MIDIVSLMADHHKALFDRDVTDAALALTEYLYNVVEPNITKETDNLFATPENIDVFCHEYGIKRRAMGRVIGKLCGEKLLIANEDGSIDIVRDKMQYVFRDSR